MLRLALIALICACGDNIDANGQSHDLSDLLAEKLTAKGAVHGTVYRCESGAECLSEDGKLTTEEWCWKQDDETGLEELLAERTGASFVDCWPITVGERWFPAIAGCAWRCDPPLDVPGANAHCGVACGPEDV
jgi:hypothetical protein